MRTVIFLSLVTLMAALSACVVAPYGDDYGAYPGPPVVVEGYYYGHDHDHDHDHHHHHHGDDDDRD